MNTRANAWASIVFLRLHQCALFVMWWTIITIQSLPFCEIGMSVMKSMLIICQQPWALRSGCKRTMQLLLRRLVQWHNSQPTMSRCVSRHICFQHYTFFKRKSVWSALNRPPAGASWASWRILSLHHLWNTQPFSLRCLSFFLFHFCPYGFLHPFFFVLLLCSCIFLHLLLFQVSM